MHAVAKTITCSLQAATDKSILKRTYVMRGSCSEKALETYHLILAPSFQCNLECRHCYLPDHNSLALPKERVISLVDEWSEIVLAERGPMGGIFHLKGGEPLLLPYLNDVLDRLGDIKTLRFMMTTNGTIGNQDVVERLDRLNNALDGGVQVIVSIDGSNDEINAQLRGPGNFVRATQFVRQLRQAGITVFLNNVIHRGNLDDIGPFVDFAMGLGVTQVNFLSFVPRGSGEGMRADRPEPQEVFNRLQMIWETGDTRVRELLAGSLSDILHTESCGICTSRECVGAYRGLLYIVPDGTAYACPNLIHPCLEAGSIFEAPLESIHGTSLPQIYYKIKSFSHETQGGYMCKGQECLQDSDDVVNVELRPMSCAASDSHCEQGVSYCFSRNF